MSNIINIEIAFIFLSFYGIETKGLTPCDEKVIATHNARPFFSIITFGESDNSK